MHPPSTQPEPTFGYLSTFETPEYGYFGGYLLVNSIGRPMEFHCSAPIRPSRAQEILYGKTLQPYLLGEQIGGSLLREAQLQPQIVLTDQAATLCLREAIGIPLVYLAGSALAACTVSKPTDSLRLTDSEDSTDDDMGSVGELLGKDEMMRHIRPEVEKPWQRRFTFGGYQFELPFGFVADRGAAIEFLAVFARHVDLAEPFDRIRMAIREAQRLGTREPEAHGQAAA